MRVMHEALLSRCALNNLVVLKTVFQKKDIYKVTWQHLGSKQWIMLSCVRVSVLCVVM